MYIALKRMQTESGWKNPGDPVPEAARWRNLRAYIEVGRIKEVPDAAVAAPEPEPVADAAVVTPEPTVEETPTGRRRKRRILGG